MASEENVGPHAEFETFINYIAIYKTSVEKLLYSPTQDPGTHYHLGILQIAIAVEALLSRLYLEYILPNLPNAAQDNLDRLSVETRWYLSPILIQVLRGKRPKFFNKGTMPFQGLYELIKFRNATAHPNPELKFTGKMERPFISDGDPGAHLSRRTFWDRQEWPILRIHKHPECVSREELQRVYDLFLVLIAELNNLTDNLVTLEWATTPTFTIRALIA